MAEIIPKNTRIAKTFAAPFILRHLRSFTAEALNRAVKEKTRLVTKFVENPQYLKTLRYTVQILPFIKEGIVKRALPNFRSKPWIRWFITNECQHKRPDLYAVFMYNPDAWDWLVNNLVELSMYLESEL